MLGNFSSQQRLLPVFNVLLVFARRAMQTLVVFNRMWKLAVRVQARLLAGGVKLTTPRPMDACLLDFGECVQRTSLLISNGFLIDGLSHPQLGRLIMENVLSRLGTQMPRHLYFHTKSCSYNDSQLLMTFPLVWLCYRVHESF